MPRSLDLLLRSSACPMPSRTLARRSGRSAGCSRSSRASGRSSSSSTICTGHSRRCSNCSSIVADWVREVPILLLCLARPDLLDERPHWGGGRANASSILLEPLSEPESELLIEGLGGSEPAGSGPARRSSRRRRGTRSSSSSCSPMRARLRQVTRSSRSRPRSRRCSPPASMRLEPQERETLERAAVVGQRFSSAAVARAPSRRPADRLPQLVLRARAQGARAPRATGRVGRGGVSLSPRAHPRGGLRATCRRRRGRSCTSATPTGSSRRPASRAASSRRRSATTSSRPAGTTRELGLSDERTHQLARRASVRLASAGQAAVYRDTPVASGLLERAAALLPADDAARLEILPELAEALFLAGKLAQATGRLRGGDRGRRTPGRPPNRGLTRSSFSLDWRLVTGQEGEADRAQRVAEDARAVFEEAGDELGLARAWSLFGQSGWARGQRRPVSRCVRARARARAASATRAPAGADPRLCEFRIAVVDQPTSTRSPARGEQTLDWARANGNRYLEANMLGFPLGLSDAMRGRIDRAAGRSPRRKRSSKTSACCCGAATYSVQRATSSGSQATRLRRSESCARSTSCSRRRTNDACDPSMQRASRPCALPAEPLGRS